MSDIPREGLDLQYDADAETLDLENSGAEFVSTIHLQFRVGLMDRTVMLSGAAEAEARFQCVRCLKSVPFPLRLSFQMYVEPAESRSEMTPGEEHELHRDELDEHYYLGDTLDLAELVREQILLALPTYPLCQADCRGLCPKCGMDLNQASCRCAAEEPRPSETHFQELLKKIIKK